MPAPTTPPVGTGLAGTYYFLERTLDQELGRYNGVFSGLNVTAAGTPSMTLTVAAGTYHQGDPTVPNRDYAGGTVTLAAADADRARVDIVSIYWAGSASVVVAPASSEALRGQLDNSAPVPNAEPPSSGSGVGFNVVLALVYVPAAATSIPDDNIYDRRGLIGLFLSGHTNTIACIGALGATGGEIAYWNSNMELQIGPQYTQLPAFVSQQGLYNNDSTERNTLSFTIPAGRLGTDRAMRWLLVGRILFNSGTPTWTLRIKFGATTIMGDATSSITANTTARALAVWGTLCNVGSLSVQRCVIEGGYIGAVTAGSIAGIMDLAVANTATNVFITGHGTAAEDTTADKVFTISSQFSVANAAVEIAWKGLAYMAG